MLEMYDFDKRLQYIGDDIRGFIQDCKKYSVVMTDNIVELYHNKRLFAIIKSGKITYSEVIE